MAQHDSKVGIPSAREGRLLVCVCVCVLVLSLETNLICDWGSSHWFRTVGGRVPNSGLFYALIHSEN